MLYACFWLICVSFAFVDFFITDQLSRRVHSMDERSGRSLALDRKQFTSSTFPLSIGLALTSRTTDTHSLKMKRTIVMKTHAAWPKWRMPCSLERGMTGLLRVGISRGCWVKNLEVHGFVRSMIFTCTSYGTVSALYCILDVRLRTPWHHTLTQVPSL